MTAQIATNYVRQAFYDRVGRRVRELREGAGMTREDLSIACGASTKTLETIESGLNCPLHLAVAISGALDCNLYDIVGTEESS